MGLWLVVKPAYAACFRSGANLLLGSFGSGGEVEFRPLSADIGHTDTKVVCTNRNAPDWQDEALRISSRYVGYVPTVALISLVMATPMAWRRRLWALLWGVPLVYGFVALRLAMALLNKFSYDNPIRAVELSLSAKNAVLYVNDAISGSIFMCDFVAPTVIWVIVSFRRSDWESLCRLGEERGGSQVRRGAS